MENDLISVIIPVYNVEKYLPQCLNSVVAQTYDNLEIILVNDGSTDSSGKICDEYKQKDSRITCIHKKNGGLSDARNAGIHKMTGKYVTFIDSDDYVDGRFIEILYRVLCDNNATISICNFTKVLEGEKPEISESEEKYHIRCFDNMQALRALYDDKLKYQFTMACGKLFDAALIAKFEFPKGRNYEDTATSQILLDKAKKVVYIDRKQYFYLTRETSITKSEVYMTDDVIIATYDRVRYFEEKGYLDLLREARGQYITTMMGVYAGLRSETPEVEFRKKELYKKIKLYMNEHRQIISTSLVFRFRVCLFLLLPDLYGYIIRRVNYCNRKRNFKA